MARLSAHGWINKVRRGTLEHWMIDVAATSAALWPHGGEAEQKLLTSWWW